MFNTVIQFLGLMTFVKLVGTIVARLGASLLGQRRMAIDGRWVVVTGCDSGIGHGVMQQLIAADVKVIALCLSEAGARAALAAGAQAAPQLDLTDEAAVDAVADQIGQLCKGKLWGVVHNAGIVQAGFVEFQPLDNYRRTMDVNFFAIVNLTQRLIPLLKSAEGRVILVSSVDGIVSLPGNAPYDASKFAVEAYADALRIELSFWNIEVSVINPSTLKTPLAMRFFESGVATWEQMDRLDPDGAWKQAYPRRWIERYSADNTPTLERIAQPPIHAVKDIYHALTSRRPRFRYLSGTAAKTLFYALWRMPEPWSHVIKKGLVNPPPHLE